MNCIINGRILLKDGEITGKALLFDDKIIGISDAVPEKACIIDAKGGYISPGLIDVHCHGFLGRDASNGSFDELRYMSEKATEWGVTAWLPTTMTLSRDRLQTCFETGRRARKASIDPDWKGAHVLGIHAEGPFINPKRKGAQAEEWVQSPDTEMLDEWKDVIRLITVAPEVEGALPFIQKARETGIIVSMGHTDATAAEALAGFEAGITHATHTFNAMPPLNHREPGAAGAALADDRVYCEMIGDGFHINPLLFGVMAILKQDKLVIITDSIQVAGLPDGIYDMSGETVIVEGIKCRFPNGTIAGSSLTMDRAVRNVWEYTKLPLWKVVNMASLNPAASIGIEGFKGSIEPGKDADILITDEQFNILRTFVSGKCVYNKNVGVLL